MSSRLDLLHHATRMMLNGELHLVKLPKKLERILDLGTGIWAIAMAEYGYGNLIFLTC